MKKIIWLAVFIVFFAVGAGVYELTQYEAQKIPVTAGMFQDFSYQKSVKKEWMESLRDFANETKNQRVQEVLAAMENKTVDAIPTKDSVRIIGADAPIRIVILAPEDARYSMWKERLEQKKVGAYFWPRKDVRAIVLKDGDSLTKKTEGLLFSHEGSHSLLYLEKPYGEEISAIEFCRIERDVALLENPLYLTLGGRAYADFSAKKVQEMADNFRQNGSEIQIQMADASYLQLEKIFGPWKSEWEGTFWIFGAWTDVMFRFIDENAIATLEQKNEMKAIGLCSAYRNLGIL